MSSYRCSYPVTPEVLAACKEFAEIGQILRLPAQGRSEKEIVRLLDNAHYEHIARLLNFIESMLSRPDSIGQRLLQQTDPFQFNQFLAELFLFSHLSDRLGKRVRPVIKGPSDKGPDIEAQWGNLLVRIETYSPIDFMGFQLIGKHILPLFKYLDVVRGFSLKVSIKPADISVQGVWYPYSIPGEEEVLCWLQGLAGKARVWLSQSDPERRLRVEGPGGTIMIDVELKELIDDPATREVLFIPGTHSTDTRLFFECGTPEDTAASQWGRKLKSKLEKRQAGPPRPNTMRVLVVDFAQADTARPDFICWPGVADRLAETVRLLVDDIPPSAPYDILIPAQLGLDCGFGPPVWIEASIAHAGDDFIRGAGMDRLCVRQAQHQRHGIDEVLGA